MHTIINGQHVQYLEAKAGADGHVLLINGIRYTFQPIPIFSIDPPNTIANLVEVELLAYGSDKWMLGDTPLLEWLEKVQVGALAALHLRRDTYGLPRIPLGDLQQQVFNSPELHFRGQSDREDQIVREINSEFFGLRYVRRWGLVKLLEVCGEKERLRQEVSAAAWFEGNYTPLLLRDFRIVPPPIAELSPPEYFHGFAEAAKYVGKSERTVKEWKRRGWLEVEQEGRKIRVSRSELDKCLRKPGSAD